MLFKRDMELEHEFVAAGGLLLAGPDPTGDGGVLPGLAISARWSCWWRRDLRRWRPSRLRH